MKPLHIFLMLAIPVMGASAIWLAPPGTRGLSLGLGALLVALAVIDLATYRLPDLLNVAVLLLGAAMVALTRPALWPHHLLGAGIGYVSLVAIEIAYRHFKGRDGLGRGDAKLMGAIGMWVAWPGLAPVLLIASLSGLVAALVMSRARRQAVSYETRIAFGPWIALGGWVVWLAQPALGALG
jgi:leader peptidase (prepilin peptidase)/N-methyltransferase